MARSLPDVELPADLPVLLVGDGRAATTGSVSAPAPDVGSAAYPFPTTSDF